MLIANPKTWRVQGVCGGESVVVRWSANETWKMVRVEVEEELRMAAVDENDIKHLYQKVCEILGDDSKWPKWGGGWCNRADLALLDAIYSTRQKYETTVLPRVRKWEIDHPSPSIPELEYLAKIDEAEIRAVFGKNVLPGVRIPGLKSGKRKSIGVVEVAQLLCSPGVGLGSAQVICDAIKQDRKKVLQLLKTTKGVGTATASYFLILLGIDGVKVDTLLGSWVRTQMDDVDMTDDAVSELVARVASERFKRKARDLDYAIWRHESVRRAGRKKS